MRAIDNDYIDYLNDGGTGYGGPLSPIPPSLQPQPASAPPVMTTGTPTTAAPAPAPAGAPAWTPESAAGLENMADDLQDDWQQWMFPRYMDALSRDNSAVSDAMTNAERTAQYMGGLAFNTGNAATTLDALQHGIYIPQAQRIYTDARQFDRAGFAERAAQSALGDMGAAFQNDRDAARMRHAQYGIDPTSGRAMAFDRVAQIMHGANTASAANRARTAAEELWGKKQMDAMNTAGILNANAAAIGGLNTQAGALHTGAAGVRKLGLDASQQAFTNVGSLLDANNKMYGLAGTLRNDAGQQRLGGFKAIQDSADARYGIDKNFESNKYNTDKQLEGQKYSADRGADAANQQARATRSAGNASALGSIVGTAAGFFMF